MELDGPNPSKSPQVVAADLESELRALPVRNTPNVRAVRRKYSRRLKTASPEFMHALASELLEKYNERSVAYELIREHEAAFQALEESELEVYGQGIDSWWTVDSFGRTLAGPAWLNGQISDEMIHRWARSEDRWWRRAALVSTVELNMQSHGGMGDTPRTLEVCRMLVEDHDDMVGKAMSWALRELVVHDPEAVRAFLSEYEPVLAARVKREVTNKLETGLKNPRR